MPYFARLMGTRTRGSISIEAMIAIGAVVAIGTLISATLIGMGQQAAQGLRANVYVTADPKGFDVTVEVLNGVLSGLVLRYLDVDGGIGEVVRNGNCIVAANGQILTDQSPTQLHLVGGQSATCRFDVTGGLQAGKRYVYIVYGIDGKSGKAVQLVKGVVMVGIS